MENTENIKTAKPSLCFFAVSKRKEGKSSKQKEIVGMSDPNQFKLEMAKLNAGWIGRFLGYQEGASQNFAFIISILLVIFALVISLVRMDCKIWEIILPVITLALGYLFGKR